MIYFVHFLTIFYIAIVHNNFNLESKICEYRNTGIDGKNKFIFKLVENVQHFLKWLQESYT